MTPGSLRQPIPVRIWSVGDTNSLGSLGPLGSCVAPRGNWLGTTLLLVVSGSACANRPQASERHAGQQEITSKQTAHRPQSRQQFLKCFIKYFVKLQ